MVVGEVSGNGVGAGIETVADQPAAQCEDDLDIVVGCRVRTSARSTRSWFERRVTLSVAANNRETHTTGCVDGGSAPLT